MRRELEREARRAADAGESERNAELHQFLDSEQWPALQAYATRCRIGFYLHVWFPGGEPSEYSFAVKDAAGYVVESVKQTALNSSACLASLGAALEVDLLVGRTASVQATVDAYTTCEYAVSNTGSGAVFGTLAILPIPSGMEVLAVRGSQGFGTVTNGQVFYEVGPLAYGSAATVKLDLVPTRTGVLTAATPAIVTVGDGLIDVNPTNNSVMLAPLLVFPPVLAGTAVRSNGTNYVELAWRSDTGRLVPQSVPRLTGPVSWTTVTNGIGSVGGQKTVRIPASDAAKFFRLRGSTN